MSSEEQPSLFIDQPYLTASGPPASTGSQIVCGDCSGDQARPLVTEQTEDGRCNVCGGRSYVVAEKFGRDVFGHRRIEGLARVEVKVIIQRAMARGLIRETDAGRDYRRFRALLHDRYGVNTTVALNSVQRADLMNELNRIGGWYERGI